MMSASFEKSSTKASCFLGCALLRRRQRLHGPDARQRLVDVHGVQKGLIVACLELVCTDQEAVWLLLNPVRNEIGREAVEGRLGDLRAVVLVLAGEGGDGLVWALALLQVAPDGVVVARWPA